MAEESFELDLDALRLQRAEARKSPRSFRFGKRSWSLPDELPLELGLQMANGDTMGTLKGLLGDQWDEFYALGPTLDDALALGTGLQKVYGFADPGESQASPVSSSSNGTRSRPTSNGSTASTSRKPSSARKKPASRSGG
jgi:hypothetical protein